MRAIRDLSRDFLVVSTPNGLGVADPDGATLGGSAPSGAVPVLARVGALAPDQLGDPNFQADYGVRVNYVAGAMANGIASEALVCAMARAGMMGFFGAAGLSTERIRRALETIQAEVGDLPWGSNLIHSPAEPRQEQETVELYLEKGVRVVSASAYMSLTPMVVQYRCTGLTQGPDGTVQIRNRLLAKVSRPEVAERFLRPAPEAMLQALVQRGRLTEAEARLGAQIPMADDLTAEADSGGHTDNRPLSVLLPLLIALRDRVASQFPAARRVRVGAAGGLGDPLSVAAAFSMGAAYVVTGTVNQACVEAGTSPMVRELLASAGMADVGMAPASDMFEGGVEVQVLKRGTLFAMRGKHLYELYRDYDGLDALPDATRQKLESKVFRRSVDEVWDETRAFWMQRDPSQVERAEQDSKHKMALVFRWYLGLSSRWAIAGDLARKTDAQVWCGPCIGAFNQWTAGTFLADPSTRKVTVVGANLMAGAAALIRARSLSHQGIDPGPEAFHWAPRPLRERPRVAASKESHVHP